MVPRGWVKELLYICYLYQSGTIFIGTEKHGIAYQIVPPSLTRSCEPFLRTFTWQPILKIPLPERLNRQVIGSNRVLGPVVLVSPFHAQLLSAAADRHSR